MLPLSQVSMPERVKLLNGQQGTRAELRGLRSRVADSLKTFPALAREPLAPDAMAAGHLANFDQALPFMALRAAIGKDGADAGDRAVSVETGRRKAGSA
jgi:hypothetical protein